MPANVRRSWQLGIALRHNEIIPHRPSLLFLHGLGDSGRAFDEAFSAPGLDEFNLIAPDMPGHGLSAGYPGGAVSFGDYATLLWRLLDALGIAADTAVSLRRPLLVIGHSMGGPVATQFCASDADGVVRGLINVEGNLTGEDLFISGKAVRAHQRGEFDPWFRIHFIEQTVGEKWAPQSSANRRYYDAIRLCRPGAFLRGSRELVERSAASAEHPHGEIADTYLALRLPKLYCHGDGCPAETRAFLHEHREESRHFPGAGHSVMIDAAAAFYAEVLLRARGLARS